MDIGFEPSDHLRAKRGKNKLLVRLSHLEMDNEDGSFRSKCNYSDNFQGQDSLLHHSGSSLLFSQKQGKKIYTYNSVFY